MTYVTDPIGDLLTRMRNAQHVRKAQCRAPWSRLKQQLCELLKKEGWITEVSVEGEGHLRELVIQFDSQKPRLDLQRVSKPGRRVYTGSDELKPILRGYGSAIITTSQGLMTDAEARSKNVGGEVLCTIS